MRYWQPIGAKPTATCSLLHPENERQQSINSFMSCIFGNQGFVRFFTPITELLTALIGNNTPYQSDNTNSKLMDIAHCETCKNILLDVENTILIRYY